MLNLNDNLIYGYPYTFQYPSRLCITNPSSCCWLSNNYYVYVISSIDKTTLILSKTIFKFAMKSNPKDDKLTQKNLAKAANYNVDSIIETLIS